MEPFTKPGATYLGSNRAMSSMPAHNFPEVSYFAFSYRRMSA